MKRKVEKSSEKISSLHRKNDENEELEYLFETLPFIRLAVIIFRFFIIYYDHTNAAGTTNCSTKNASISIS